VSAFFSNANVNRLSAHTALRQLAYGIGGVFSAVFLLRVGITPVGIFLVFAAIFLVRFAFRPPALLIIRAIGLRPALIAGTVLMATQYPLLALVTGMGPALVLFCLVSALANVLYWPCYHTVFSAVGDVQRRGSQVGARQLLGAVAGICGPAAGGLALALFGPWAAFGAAAAIEAAAILPLLRVPAPSLPNGSPNDTREGFLLFATDAWVINGSALAWYMVMFPVLQSRFDAFGGVLALAAFAGAIAGLVVGHFIDKGHGRRAILLNAILVFASMVVRAFCGSEPIAIVAAAVFAAVTGGLYIPTLMSAVYNVAKASPNPLLFQFAAERGWDVAGALVCLLAAALCARGIALQPLILLATPAVAVQAWLLDSVARRPLQQAADRRLRATASSS
jgi:DHA1 family inner membrane transport protein